MTIDYSKAMKKVVAVRWLDASHPTSIWEDEEDVEIPNNKIVTYGKLIKENESYIVVAQAISEEGHVSGCFTITKPTILSLDILEDN